MEEYREIRDIDPYDIWMENLTVTILFHFYYYLCDTYMLLFFTKDLVVAVKFTIQHPEKDESSLQNYTNQFIEAIKNQSAIEPFNSISPLPNLVDSAIIGQSCQFEYFDKMSYFCPFSADQPPEPPSGDMYIGFVKFILPETPENPLNVNTKMTKDFENSLKSLVTIDFYNINSDETRKIFDFVFSDSDKGR